MRRALQTFVIAILALLGGFALASGLWSYMHGYSVGLGALGLIGAGVLWLRWFGRSVQ